MRLSHRVHGFFYRRWPHWYEPRKVCCRCPAVIRDGGRFAKRKVSHGLCGRCAEDAHDMLALARRALGQSEAA